jgi:hypothetical protein
MDRVVGAILAMEVELFFWWFSRSTRFAYFRCCMNSCTPWWGVEDRDLINLRSSIARRVINTEEAEVGVDAASGLKLWCCCGHHGHGEGEKCLNSNHFECCVRTVEFCWSE